MPPHNQVFNMKKQTIVQLFERFKSNHHQWDVWRDFCECAAISIINRVDIKNFDTREARYLNIIKRYSASEILLFTECLSSLIDEISEYPTRDVLGGAFTELGLYNAHAGQFFTPTSISTLMAKLQIPGMKQQIAEKGLVTVHEPAIGSGSTIIGMVNAMRESGLNYQQSLFVEGWDIDERAIHMCYLQLSLLHVPARLIYGDSLRMEARAVWCTPAYFMRQNTSGVQLKKIIQELAA